MRVKAPQRFPLATGQVRAAQLLDAIAKPATFPGKYGPATPLQEEVAAVVNARAVKLRPQLNVELSANDAQTVLAAPALDANGRREQERLARGFQAMSDEDMGRTVRQGQTLLHAYLNRGPDDATSHLMGIAGDALIASSLAMMGGRRDRVFHDIHRVRERFERDFFASFNGELARGRALAKAFIESEKEQLADKISEIQAELKRLADENELVEHAAEAAQREATEARRELDRFRSAEGQRRAALEGALEEKRQQLQGDMDRQAQEVALQQQSVSRERRILLDREREWNKSRQQLEADKKAAQDLVGSLNAELTQKDVALAAALAELETLRAGRGPLEVTQLPDSPNAPLSAEQPTAADALSLRAFLVEQGMQASVTAKVVTADAPITPALLAAWAEAYPDAQARHAHVAAAMRKGRAA